MTKTQTTSTEAKKRLREKDDVLPNKEFPP
jgi:hypothetical protein